VSCQAKKYCRFLTGLKGLHSIDKDQKTKLLIEKLSGVAEKSDYMPAGNEIMIDLSSWNKNDRLHLRINEIKKAIRMKNIINFTYYTNGKLTKREVEPCVIVFKESNWYLYGYCLLRNDFRLFKLRRISELEITEKKYVMRDYKLESADLKGDFEQEKDSEIVLLFEHSMKYIVDDIFGIDNYEVMQDGKLKVRFKMGLGDWLYGFVLGFGGNVEILEPLALKEHIIGLANDVIKKYGKHLLY